MGSYKDVYGHENDVLQARVRAIVKNNKYKDVYGHKAFAPAIVSMSGQIHADFLRLLWVLAGKQLRSYYESMGKEEKIGNEAFRWTRAKVFNYNKKSVGRAIALAGSAKLQLVGPLPLAAPPAAICLCTVL